VLPKRTAAAAAAAGCGEVPEREVTYMCVYSERDAAEETISRISLYLTATCLHACNKLVLHFAILRLKPEQENYYYYCRCCTEYNNTHEKHCKSTNYNM
jgi:hypothetical protein